MENVISLILYLILITRELNMDSPQIIVPHILINPWDTIIVNTPDGEMELKSEGLNDDWRLKLSNGSSTFISLWSFFIQREDWAYIPIYPEKRE